MGFLTTYDGFHRLTQNFFLLFRLCNCPRVVVDVGGAGMMEVKAHGTVGGFILGTAVVHAGATTFRRLVSAVNAKFRSGGHHLPAFGTFF